MSDFLAEFVTVTGAAESIASQYLSRNNNDVEAAINDFYANESSSPVEKSKKQESKPKSMFQSFSDLRNRGAPADGEDPDDLNFFTGGEKSGLEVENPDKKKKTKTSRSLVDDLLRKAEEDSGKPDWREEGNEKKSESNSFTGQGHSLGSIEQAVESNTFGSSLNSTAGGDQRHEKVTRTITFWKEGFSVDDGKLFKYDDKENQEYLAQLNSGRAPLSLLNVKMFQDVDVNVHKRLEDSYYTNQEKKPRTFGFTGQGQRLGSPVPGEIIPQVNVVEPVAEVEPAKKEPSAGEGDTSIQIRLTNGERIIRKFNSTDTVQVIYNFVSEVNNGDGKPWTLALSFPMTVLDEKKESTILEAGLKNSVIIQRWK